MMDSNSNRYLTDIHGYSRIFDGYPTDIRRILRIFGIRIFGYQTGEQTRIFEYQDFVKE